MFLEIVLAIILIYALIILLASFDKDTNNADYLVVLGYKLIGDLLSLTLIMRLDKAYKYLINNPNCKVILSGGKIKNSSIPEAIAMEEYLLKKGISKDRIIKEMCSLDTIDNIKYCKDIIKGNPKITIISSRYHILRVRMICKFLGMNAKFIGSNSSPQDSIVNLFKEEYLIIKNYIMLKKSKI